MKRGRDNFGSEINATETFLLRKFAEDLLFKKKKKFKNPNTTPRCIQAWLDLKCNSLSDTISPWDFLVYVGQEGDSSQEAASLKRQIFHFA